MATLERAIQIAARAHEGQKDKVRRIGHITDRDLQRLGRYHWAWKTLSETNDS